MKLPKAKPVWEYTAKQQAAISVGIVLLLTLGLATIPKVLFLIFVGGLVTFLVWAVIFKMIPAMFFDRF